MAGIYIWQLNTEGQNDALLYGGGFEYDYNNWKMTASYRGYSGYRKDGDRPIVIRSSIEKRCRSISVMLNIQQGIHDYDFTSVENWYKNIFFKYT
jgi:hypothetical protein